MQLSSLSPERRYHQVRLCRKTLQRLLNITRAAVHVLLTCDSVRYRCDNQSLELRLDSGLQVLHLQYHPLRLWTEVSMPINPCCNQLVNEERAHVRVKRALV